MTELVLGPIVRRADEVGATIWVETDGPCEVEVLGCRERTFHVGGHHYALVDLDGLAPGESVEYDVRLDGRVVWPPSDSPFPPSRLRCWAPGTPYRLLVGSCQQAAPHEPPWNENDPGDLGVSGPDALHAWARHLLDGDAEWPDALFLAGDQVYADQAHPQTRKAIEERRGGPPEEGWPAVASFEEYTWLYEIAWSPPLLRWFLSCLPVVMIFDDHDVIDDWNTSAEWRDQIEAKPWWSGRIHGALMSYWLYQHLGNVRREERADDDLLAAVKEAEDGEAVLRAFSERADAGTPGNAGHRWSYCRELGPARFVVVDSRNGRVFGKRRSMLDELEWEWLDRRISGGVDHLLIGSSLPWLLPPSIHDLEAWDEQVADGAWGRVLGRVGEGVRQIIDLEHWAAFGDSFQRLSAMIRSAASGERGEAPSTVLVLSGDVHFAYVAEADIDDATSRVRQIVTSPIRQAVHTIERHVQRAMLQRPMSAICRALVRTTPSARPSFGWKVTDGPQFQNNIALLTFEGSEAHLDLDVASLDSDGRPVLERVLSRPL